MRPLLATNLNLGIVFGVALLTFAVLQIVAGVRGMFAGGFRVRRPDGFDRGSLIVVAITGGFGIGGAVWLSYRAQFATIAPDIPTVRYVVFFAGIVLLLGGTAFRQWAIITLGRSFTYDVRVASGQQVITAGPYRWLRHPSYTGLVVSYIGFGLAFGNWLSALLAFVLPTAGLVRRVFVEEAALRSKLGAPYEQFAATRKRLVPGIW